MRAERPPAARNPRPLANLVRLARLRRARNPRPLANLVRLARLRRARSAARGAAGAGDRPVTTACHSQ
jgi:hypothetical protein